MKNQFSPKCIPLFLVLILSSAIGVPALMDSIQLKPSDLQGVSNVLIRSWSNTNEGNQTYWIALLPGARGVSTNLQGWLEIRDRTNHVASCPIAATALSDAPAKGWDAGMKRQYYMAMTNKFSRPLNGAKLFTFTVKTNLLADTTFTLGEGDLAIWFHLQDFANSPSSP